MLPCSVWLFVHVHFHFIQTCWSVVCCFTDHAADESFIMILSWVESLSKAKEGVTLKTVMQDCLVM